MRSGSRSVAFAHRLVLRLSRRPFTIVWAAAYRLAARAWAAYLVRGSGPAVAYVRGSLASGEVLPGLSDIDVAVVVQTRGRAIARWQALRKRFPSTDLLLDYPMIFEPGDLRHAMAGSAFTCRGTAYSGPLSTQDTVRLLERPGLYAPADGWRLMFGPDRLPDRAPLDEDERRMAAWLELVAWWSWVAPACVAPQGPRTAGLCVKLIAEPARIWLWLAHGEKVSRLQALRRCLVLLPEEEHGLRLALDLHRSLWRSPEPPLKEVLPVLVSMSERIAGLLELDARQAGSMEVALAGVPPSAPLPLCDWRALVQPGAPERSLTIAGGDLRVPADLARATNLGWAGPLNALRSGDLIAFMANRNRTRMRSVACPTTDPVSFALADSRRSAQFPELPGWRAADVARRAVAEHRCVLDEPDTHPEARDRLLGAARAALFAESVQRGEPLLAVTLEEAGRRLAERAPDTEAVAGLRAAVKELPALAA